MKSRTTRKTLRQWKVNLLAGTQRNIPICFFHCKDYRTCAREIPSIEAKYQDYLLHLNGWSNQSEPEIEFFHQKSLFYLGVIERLGPSALRTSVLMDFVKFLEQNSYQQVGKVDWFCILEKAV